LTATGQDKASVRQQLLDRRDAISENDRYRAAQKIAQTGLAFTGRSRGVVSGFCSFGSEIDLLPLLSKLSDSGYVTALPVIVAKGKPLIFRAWKPGDPLIEGTWSIPVPAKEADVVVPEIVLVPLLGFDDEGYRIGYGGGFYDRTLAMLKKSADIVSIGLAFAAQHVPYVPREPHDVPLDWVLTERGARKCNRESGV